jgi:hypothetical protein
MKGVGDRERKEIHDIAFQQQENCFGDTIARIIDPL